jgi:hypothetical protein
MKIDTFKRLCCNGAVDVSILYIVAYIHTTLYESGIPIFVNLFNIIHFN